MSSKFTPVKPKTTHSDQLSPEELRRMEMKQYNKLLEVVPTYSDEELKFLLGVDQLEFDEIKHGGCMDESCPHYGTLHGYGD